MNASEQMEIARVDARLHMLVVAVISIPVALLMSVISYWAAFPPLLIATTLSFNLYRGRYLLVALVEEKRICKVFGGGKKECIALESNAEIKLITLHRYHRYVVSASSNKAQMDLIVTTDYKRATRIAQRLSSIMGATLSIDEPIWQFFRKLFSKPPELPND